MLVLNFDELLVRRPLCKVRFTPRTAKEEWATEIIIAGLYNHKQYHEISSEMLEDTFPVLSISEVREVKC